MAIFRVVAPAKWLVLALACLLVSCGNFRAPPAGIGKEISWSKVPNWYDDRQSESWPALLHNCQASIANNPPWQTICHAATAVDNPTDQRVRAFYETWFTPHIVHGNKRRKKGLITGYYEPLLRGSMSPSDQYPYPLYASPDDLLTIDLSSLYPKLKGMRLRGRLEGNRVVPFFSRGQIEANRDLLAGNELLWVDNRDDVFFLHIQGSGRVQLDDGQILAVGYANQNGHPYVSIGKILLETGELEREEISLFSIRKWLQDHPERAEQLLNENPSYIFFTLREGGLAGPIGSMNVPLTGGRSLAIDPKVVSLGTPVWLMTNEPGRPSSPYHRLLIAQDTGGAIKGALRADVFFGYGPQAEQAAGIMKEPGRLIVLIPRQSP